MTITFLLTLAFLVLFTGGANAANLYVTNTGDANALKLTLTATGNYISTNANGTAAQANGGGI